MGTWNSRDRETVSGTDFGDRMGVVADSSRNPLSTRSMWRATGADGAGLTTILDDPEQSLRAREGWFDSVAFLISFSPGIPFPGSQIKSKSCGSFFFRRNQFGFLSGAAMGATKQNEQPMTA